MAATGDKVLRVGSASYVIDEGAGTDVAMIVTEVEQALKAGTVVRVPVLDGDRNRMTLLLNGSRIETVLVDTDGIGGDRPGVISPG